MELLYKKSEKIVWILELIFKLLFLTVGFLQASSLTFGKPIISVVQWPTIALGCLLVLYRLLFLKKYLRTRGIILLVFFAVGYAISSLLMCRYGIYENIRCLVFMVFQFGLLYAFNSDRDAEHSKKQLLVCAKYYMFVVAVLSLASFIFMALGYVRTYAPAAGEEGPIYYIGFVIGRLFGAYWDPNIAATMAVISILLTLYFFISEKGIVRRVVYVLNIILQVAYITFSDSRTGKLCLIVGLVLFTALQAAKYLVFRRKAVHVICAVILVGLVAGVAYTVPKALKDGYNYIVVALSEPSAEDEEYDKYSLKMVNRGEDLGSDPSNRRFEIWNGAVEVFETSPLFGVSRANILPYVDENLPDSYLVTNDHMRFDSMHNMFFEILASQGLFGIIPFILFAVWAVIGLIRNWKYLWNSGQYKLFAVIICILGSVCASTLVMAEIVYVTSPISTMFWLCLGCMNHYFAQEKLEKKA